MRHPSVLALVYPEPGRDQVNNECKHVKRKCTLTCKDIDIHTVWTELTWTADNKWDRYIVTTCLCFFSQSCNNGNTLHADVKASLSGFLSAFPPSSDSPVCLLLTWSCWVSIEILFCNATCCPGLLWWVVEEEDMMPKGGVRAPKASFSRKTSLDNSVICKEKQTSDLALYSQQLSWSGRRNSHLSVLFLDQTLGFLDVVVELLNVAGLGL